MMTGSDGVSFRLPQLFFSQHRLPHKDEIQLHISLPKFMIMKIKFQTIHATVYTCTHISFAVRLSHVQVYTLTAEYLQATLNI